MSSKNTQSQRTELSNPLEEGPDDTEHPPAKSYSKITVNNVEDEILNRSRGILAHINMVGPIDGVEDMSTLITKALEHYVPKFEKKHNDGEPYPAPRKLPRGRKSS